MEIKKTGTTSFSSATLNAMPKIMPKVTPKAAAASNKDEFEKKLQATAKSIDSICEEIKKKILSKNAEAAGAKNINGLCKEDLMKIINVLDHIGSTTYPVACALRDIHGKMAD